MTYTETPTSSDQTRRQINFAFHQEVSEFNFWLDEHGSAYQSGPKLQEEVRKLRKENEKLSQQIQHGLKDTLDLRMTNQKREWIPYGSISRRIQSDQLLSAKNTRLESAD